MLHWRVASEYDLLTLPHKSFLCIHSLLDINLIICFLMFVSPLKPWWLVFTSALLCFAFAISSFSPLPMASSFYSFLKLSYCHYVHSLILPCVSCLPPKFSVTTNSNTKSNFIQRNSFNDPQKQTGIAKYCKQTALYEDNTLNTVQCRTLVWVGVACKHIHSLKKKCLKCNKSQSSPVCPQSL